jgi:uncharacterized protein YcbK (DUF882 family)
MSPRAFATAVAAAIVIMCGLTTPSSALGNDLPRGLRGDGTITLFRPVKNARETFRYRNPDGSYSPAAMDAIAYFFRCRMTDEEENIDPGLIEILDALEDHFGAAEIRLISAYRSPARNNAMRSRSGRVARESYHMRGMAADIEIPGIATTSARDFAFFLNQGGVGYYSGRSFIHVDTGPQRTWGFKPHTRSRTMPATSHK